jgi:putative transposase
MEVAERHDIEIVELSVMPDVIVSIPPTMTVLKFNLLLPSELFRQQPKFRLRYPKGHFWGPGKFCRSVGDADLPTVIGYVGGCPTVYRISGQSQAL